MRKGMYSLFLLCSFVGLSSFFTASDTIHAEEQPEYSMGILPVRGSIGKTEDERTTDLDELGNELVDIRVLIPKERSATSILPQTGEVVFNWLIKVLGIVLLVIGLSYFGKYKREKRKA